MTFAIGDEVITITTVKDMPVGTTGIVTKFEYLPDGKQMVVVWVTLDISSDGYGKNRWFYASELRKLEQLRMDEAID